MKTHHGRYTTKKAAIECALLLERPGVVVTVEEAPVYDVYVQEVLSHD